MRNLQDPSSQLSARRSCKRCTAAAALSGSRLRRARTLACRGRLAAARFLPPLPALTGPPPGPAAPAAFRYSSKLAPRRLLTKPSEPASNSGWDNANHDLIVAVGDEFVSTLGSR